MGLQGGSLQLVDGGGQLITHMGEGVSAGAKLAEVISGVAEATVQQSHNLLVSGGSLRSQVASAAGAPSGVAEDLLLSRVNRIVERHANTSAAGTGIQSSVALDDAALHPLGLLKNTLRGVLKEFGARYKIRQECSAGIVFGNGSHYGLLKKGLRVLSH